MQSSLRPVVLGTALAIGISTLFAAARGEQRRTPIDTYRVVRVYPHDPTAFTQGLVYRSGVLYESTGTHAGSPSTLRRVKLETGEVLQSVPVAQPHFAEGLAELGGQLVQLTWQSNTAFVYDLATFGLRRTFKYDGEGWGLASDGKQFILSDGSSGGTLKFLDPTTFRVTRRLAVRDGGRPIDDLNELEVVKGEIYANVWHTDRIARIDPARGTVNRWIDLTGLMAGYRLTDSEAVLNGIAHDPASGRLFVTGKLWPRLFEIEIVAGK